MFHLKLKTMTKQVIMIVISIFVGFFSASAGNAIIQTEIRGAGQPMILIHGMACSAGVWEEVAAYYEDRYELHLVSISGFGNRASFEAPHILKAIRDALIGYVHSEGLHKPILMGHSMGGFLSLWAAAEAPDLFGKIISVDGLPYFPVLAMPGMTPETAGPIAEMMQNNMRNASPEAARAQQEMMIATMISDPAKRAVVLEMGMQSNPDVIARAMGEMYTTDIRNQVSAIDIPVLALGSWYGYRQWGVTKESASAGYLVQFDPIPNASFKMAATALHFIFYDDPDWFFEAVDGFLAEKKSLRL
ncbi:MAG: alpha/beta hydrolase [Bacteroidetes bacterium]|nr:MAG: alpha/beta hydrolase [Bacteroidota bacterium]